MALLDDFVSRPNLGTEHPTLAAVANELVSFLEHWTLEVRPVEGASGWVQHHEFAKRTEELAGHLWGIIDLAEAARFPSAMVLARTGIEHHVLDRLLLLADRSELTLRLNDPDEAARLESEWDQRSEPWTQQVVSVRRVRRGRDLVLVQVRDEVRDGDGKVVEHLSPYYAALEHYNGRLGAPSAVAETLEPFRELDQLVERADLDRKLHEDFLRWKSLLDNLRLNALVPDAAVTHLKVHYTFLSTFTHAATGYRIRTRLPATVRDTHLFGELALLYAITIAVVQVDIWCSFITRRPELLQPIRSELMASTEQARSIVGYFWFLLGAPQPYDRFQEANRLAYRGRQRAPVPNLRPEHLLDHQVKYYPDPFHRLAQLHSGGGELTTGFSFPPMWGSLRW